MESRLQCYKTVCRRSEEGEILDFPKGKTIGNGKIIPVICIMYRTSFPVNQAGVNAVTVEEHTEISTDFYGWKNKKIKVRKMLHVRADHGYDPKYYEVIRYSFYYLEDMS
jgi:hypothetical protein